MAKYKAYPEYKESGVEWIDSIPSYWEVKPTFALCDASTQKNIDGAESNVLSLSYGNIIPRDVETNFGLLPESFNTYQVISCGDVILRLTDLQNDKNSLRVGLAKQKGIITSAYLKLKANSDINPNFLYRLLHSYDTTKVFYGMGGGLRQSMKFEDFRRLPLLLPPYEEQIKISAFLDHETAKIDNLIEKQKQLIELLKEKRQAVISHAVTKGLNPNVPMKDSGVEWLGYIPKHWERSRIGWMCNVGNGCTPGRENTLYWQDGSYPWLNSSKVNDERILTAEQFVTTKALYECSLPIVKKGSVIMAITGEGKTRGTSALMMIDATINQHVAYITPRAKNKISPEFIHLWLQSKYQQIRTSSEGWGSTKAAITCSDVKCYPIPVPPLKEQAEIVRAIEEKKTIFTNLLLSCEKEIEILQERRTALISAAVTGKIDIRNWVAPDTQNVEEPQEATA
ncbi:type I restriction enzyme, S subunit [Enterobacter sp. kpr-6]|uniref:restriction endonuclease subunit S n=1 Tax=Enterobacter sp. kpr-6 TaxID=1761782 RepID=UPI0008E327C4|nr:restriction endonuclease subunit S [Enterobacter sp. kpr-6]SFR09062.1 type I restriction enzyme, S subunit [Enterobacter sp. kpr-6]